MAAIPSEEPSSMREALDQERDKQAWVNWLFASIAPRYDLGNHLMSAGMHRVWKRRLVALADVRPEHRVLDLCCGTGDVSYLLAARAAEVVGCDINPEMMAVAERKRPADCTNVTFVQGDATALPFESGRFDRVTCSYGGRSLPDFPAVLREVHRVLAPGGTFWNLDFARPPNRAWDSVYRGWMTASGAALGLALHGDPRTYIYIPATMRRYPGQRWLEEQLVQAGFEARTIETLACLMAFNCGMKPA